MISILKGFFDSFLEKAKMAEYTFMVFLAVLIGALGGIVSIGVRFLIKLITEISFGSEHHISEMSWYWLILIPTVGGAIVGPIIYFFAREAKGHGVPEVMEAVVKQGGVIRSRVALVKALASSLCIGTGGSTGKEGPIVQIGASIGSAIGQWFKLPPNKLKTLVGCGAAAGIAATFNAPIAGALFAAEIILGEFGVAQFSPIVISSVIATVVTRQVFPDSPLALFNVPAYELVSAWELIPYAILGLLGGLIAVLFTKVLYKTEDIFDKISIPEYIKPAIGGALVGLVGIWFYQTLGTGHEIVNTALTINPNDATELRNLFPTFLKPESLKTIFNSDLAWGLIVGAIVLIMVFIKILGTSLTLGSGGSGGIFAPSLFIGAMLGAGFGSIIHTLFPEITASPGAYSLVAMGAVVSAVTHAPITAILIIFELTSDYKIILPLMIACIISTLFARRLMKESMYTLKLVRKGINIEAGREINILKAISVKDVMENKKAVIPSSMKLSDVLSNIVNSAHTCFVVVDDNENILGSFTLHDFKRILIDYENLKDVVIARDMVEHKTLYVKEADNLNDAMYQFGKGTTDELPVLDQEEKKVIGVLWKNDVINAYNHEMLKADMANGIAGRISTIEKLEAVEVLDGFFMIEIPVPKIFVGKTLRSVNVRAKYGVEIILIKKLDESHDEKKELIISVPPGDYLFESHDRLLLFGEDSKIDRVKKL